MPVTISDEAAERLRDFAAYVRQLEPKLYPFPDHPDRNTLMEAALVVGMAFGAASVLHKALNEAPGTKSPSRSWLIYSREHNAWWRPGRMGYTGDIEEAGRYTVDEAQGIVNKANYYQRPDQYPPYGGPIEVLVPAPEAHKQRVMLPHPLRQGRMYPASAVLSDLAGQENCEGEPYDTMQQLAARLRD